MNSSSQDTIDYLKTAFSPYNTVDIILKLSALRLLPENGEKTVRLDLLLHVAVSLKNLSGPLISRKKLNDIINSKTIRESFFKHQEDPSTNLFCEEISFYNGGYRVFPGCYSNIAFQIKNTLGALFKVQQEYLPEEIKNNFANSALFVLNISEAIAAKADIPRNTDLKYSKDIVVPNEESLTKLSFSNFFKDKELDALANELNTTLENYQWLFSKLDENHISNYKVESGPLISAPIFSYNNFKIVTDPSSLLNALREKILRVIQNNNLIKDFRNNYVQVVWNHVQESLNRLGFSQATIVDGTKVNERPFIFDTFYFDDDKLALVIMLFDNFEKKDETFIKIDLDEYKYQLEYVLNLIYSIKDAPNEIFHIFLTSNYQRAISFQFSYPNGTHLVLSVENLECISFLETKNELFLYKFAIARILATNRTRFTSFDKLAEYGLFKKYGDSFYLMDDGIPFVLYISDDYARSARKEMKIKTDIHSVYIPFKNAHVEVMLMHESDFPFYAPVYYPHNTEFLIELYSIPIWLYSKHLEEYSNHSFRKLVIEMLDNLAYWIIELRPSIEKYLNAKQIREYLFIDVLFDEKVEWGNLSSKILQTNEGAFSITINQPHKITFLFRQGLNKILATSDNSGEREIISTLLKNLSKLFNDEQLKQEFSETKIEEIVNKHMPLGKKKKIGVYDTSKIPELNPLEITKPRVIDDIDTNLLLDELGQYIVENKLTIGDKREDHYNFIKNHVVPFFLAKLNSELRKYDKQVLINYLIQQNESLTYDRVLHEIQLPMRIEIANKDTILKDFSSTYSKIIQSSPACRFLIEYSMGVKIQSIKKLSNYDYEFLLSVANEIIHWGFIGDMLRFNITGLKLSQLKSNRLFVDSKDYDKAYEVFSNQITDYNINKFNLEFSKYWEDKKYKSVANEDKSIEEFDIEFKLEFGYTLIDLIEFEKMLFKYSSEKNVTIISIEENELKRLYKGIIPSDSLNNILSSWSIIERESFLEVPNLDLGPYDFFPWRFNRKYSYVRRPLLLINIEGVLYYKIGLRHLKIAVDNFTALLRNNRLVNKLKNKKLKKILSEFASFSNIDFVKRVKGIFENKSTFLVYENVRKIGKNRIVAENGNDLGDIDVLVIDNKHHEILIIECKDLLLSRTPYEMYGELKKIFSSDNSQMKKHLLRLEWVIKNINLLKHNFKLDHKHNWKVKAYFVSSTPLFSPLVKHIKNIRYFTFKELQNKYAALI